MSSDIKLWAGDGNFLNWPRTNHQAFSPRRIEFLTDLSKELLAGDYRPELKALGFWLRKTQLVKWKKQNRNENLALRAPVGRVFIVSPSNVEGLFAYNWALSYLMGNQTVVRLSERISDDQKAFFYLLSRINDRTSGLSSQAFISYDRNSDWTEKLSNWCQLRILWGSNETIESIRQIPLHAQAEEWVFPDRYSVAVLRITQADRMNVPRLAQDFARDIGTFHQQACASPKWVIWHETEQSLQDYFWQAVDSYLNDTFMPNEVIVSSQYLCSLGAKLIHQGNLAVVECKKIIGRSQTLIGIVGQTSLNRLSDCMTLLPTELQSVACYGLSIEDKVKLTSISNVRQFSILGQSLDFNLIWDGTNILRLLSREVRL